MTFELIAPTATTTPDAEHLAAHAPSPTACTIAQAAIAVAVGDLIQSNRRLAARSGFDGLSLIEDAIEQLEAARRALNGTIWQV